MLFKNPSFVYGDILNAGGLKFRPYLSICHGVT